MSSISDLFNPASFRTLEIGSLTFSNKSAFNSSNLARVIAL